MTLRPARRMDGVHRTLIRRIFDQAPADAINLGLGQPDLPTPPGIGKAGLEAIRSGRTGYTTTAGDVNLRAAVARRHAPLAAGPKNVLITVGSQEALFAVVLALTDPGDEILHPDPGYPAYPVVARLLGARPVAYPLRRERGFRVLSQDVLERITPRTRAVILCSPSNPTGAVDRPEDIRDLVSRLEEAGVFWISDEVYAGFFYGEERPASPGRFSRAGMVVSGLSKEASMTGWRIGWAVGPEEAVERATTAHQYLVTCAPSISQQAALAALSPAGAEERSRLLDRFRRRRERMAAELERIPGIRFEPPAGAFYFFVDTSAYGDSMTLAARILERRKVVTVPGEAFGPGGAGYLRLSFAASEEAIATGVRAFAAELAEIRAGR